MEGHFLADPAVPGPGTYNIAQKVGAEGVKYSFRPKTNYIGKKYTDHNLAGSNVPGPGTYKTDIERSPGKTVVSNFRSSPTTVFTNPLLARFEVRHDQKRPGPGEYFVNEEFLKSGYQFSQFKYQGARKFARSSRDYFYKKDLDTPGPGAYRMPSEFGYYEKPDLKKNRSQTQNLGIIKGKK